MMMLDEGISCVKSSTHLERTMHVCCLQGQNEVCDPLTHFVIMRHSQQPQAYPPQITI